VCIQSCSSTACYRRRLAIADALLLRSYLICSGVTCDLEIRVSNSSDEGVAWRRPDVSESWSETSENIVRVRSFSNGRKSTRSMRIVLYRWRCVGGGWVLWCRRPHCGTSPRRSPERSVLFINASSDVFGCTALNQYPSFNGSPINIQKYSRERIPDNHTAIVNTVILGAQSMADPAEPALSQRWVIMPNLVAVINQTVHGEAKFVYLRLVPRG